MGKRVLVCGGRFFNDKNFFNKHMSEFYRNNEIDVIIQGGARGADYLAKRWAEVAQIEMREFIPEWDLYGKQAGMIRNQRMLDHGKPDIVLAFSGGRGTEDMIRRAEKVGVPVLKFSHDSQMEKAGDLKSL